MTDRSIPYRPTLCIAGGVNLGSKKSMRAKYLVGKSLGGKRGRGGGNRPGSKRPGGKCIWGKRPTTK